MKYREGINFRGFYYSTEKRYLNAFEHSLNLFYQGQNDCKMSKKLQKLHNVGSEQKLLPGLLQLRLHTAE